MLVITVAAQNLIWPQGRTYPRKAVNIRISKISIPENHAWGAKINDWK